MTEFELDAIAYLLPEDVPPSAWTGHVPFAFWIIEAMAPKSLVELGTHHGTSFLAFCQAIATGRHDTRAFAVDTWEGDEHAGFYGDDVYENLNEIVQSKYAGFATLLRTRFDDAKPQFADGSVDLLHIDGLHTYEAVKHDFDGWLSKLSERGVVLFHDTAVRDRGFGVWKFWEEVSARYPSFNFRHTHGLGVLLVGDQQPEALKALCRLQGAAGEGRVERAFDALGQRVCHRARAEFLEIKYADAEKFRVHYKAVFERAESALAAAQAALASRDAELAEAKDERAERGAALIETQAELLARREDVEALKVINARLQRSIEAARVERGAAQVRIAQLEADHQELVTLRESHRVLVVHSLASDAAQQAQAAALATREAELSAARADLRRRDALLRDAHSRTELRQGEVDRIVASRSWRITAPMRWLRACLAAIRHRRGLPAYAAMLAPPTCGRPPIPHLPVTVEGAPAVPAVPTVSAAAAAAVAIPATASQYLEELFASDVSRRAPEYLPASTEPAPRPDALRAKAIAFFLPQFHPFDENEAWWGKGFTEWSNVSKAVPQFLGHHQPQLPADLGFYDLRVADALKRQVEMARQYGLHGFAFHYYWFAGKRLMEKPLDLYLSQDDIDFPFCLCWANENWTRRWDGHDNEILISQVHGPDNDLAFIRDLEPYLRDRRYIRVDGRPLLIVYRPSILPDPAATLQRWREHCRAVGIGELFIAMTQFDAEDPRQHGFDAAMEFPPHKLAKTCEAINHTLDIVNPDYQGHVVHYQSIVDSAKAWPDQGFPLIRTVFPGWDNEARRPGKGYTFAYATPDRYQDWLEYAVGYAERNPVAGERIVMVNAWNEWAEGAKLEPDRRFGHAFLQATRTALEAPQHPRRVLLVSHDAHPHGGQYLALNLARELRASGVQVSVALLGTGRLTDDFKRICPVHEAFDDDAVAALAQACRENGTQLVIANTAVSGRVVPAFRREGIEVLTLVHELPGVIREYGLDAAVAGLVQGSRRVVVASDAVAKGLAGFADADALREKLVVQPQGLFTRSRYRGQRDAGPARAALRARLGLQPHAKIVLAVGYADPRKGIDLLAEAAVGLADLPDLHFVWVGHRDVDVQDAVDRVLREGGMADRFHFVGLDFDTDDYYAGADVYALASREDPFPSVVLESLSVGTPVLAFAGTGGGADLVAAQGGAVVAPMTAAAYADALRGLLGDDARRLALGEAGRELVDTRFSFRRYALDLLSLGGINVPKVSVVVPNYNYARYLEARLRSIASQTLPVYEIIVLDDASSDGSLDLLQSLRAGLSPEPRVVVNTQNSGSVFRQWLRGLELATGDYVWIAEADDLAHPGLLEALVGAMAKDPSIVMSYCQSEQMDPDGQMLAPDYLEYTRDVSPDRWSRAYVAEGEDEAACLGVKNVVPNVSAVVFRREPLLEVLREGIDEIADYSIAGDWVVYLRLLARGRACFEPTAFNRHRRHSSSVTIASAADKHLDEVSRAQAEAQRLFPIDEGVRRAAGDYLAVLRAQFGLDHAAREAG
ncbi:glycoside hydrolase family 99-like domain-containing protein [Arenimonas alkanexedens]